MNKHPRALIYVLIFVIALIAVMLRIIVVVQQRNMPVISFLNEWNVNGVPVEVKEMKRADVPVYIRLTLKNVTANSAQAFVTADMKKDLKENQNVFLSDKKEICGKITVVSDTVNVDTGMFLIGFSMSKKIEIDNPIVYVHTQTINNVIVVPNEILDIDSGKFSVWKVEKNLVKRTEVVLGERNGFGAVILQGLSDGDFIIVNGQSQLKDGDKINVLQKEMNAEIK